MERDFDTFDPSEALVDEGRNLYYPANWQKGDPVFVLNEPEWSGSPDPDDPDNFWIDDVTGERVNAYTGERTAFYQLEQRKGLDCE